uniref:Uncharacterized protein n=1 Tax=Anopheles atroparvus TaxID=41427 RepID=A0A182IVS2_ANOAO
ELQSVKESEAKLKQQYIESQRRERFLARRLTLKEQEVQDYANQIAELKSAQAPGPAALRSALLDPAINILFQKLKGELQATKAKLEETQNELSAWKFTPDSNTGKRLMAKCRLLYQENEELGKMTSNGRLAKLENELALQKSYNEEVKKSQLELDDFLQELDEDVEGMQSTIVFLQQELKQTKDVRDELEKEVTQLRAYVSANSPAVLAGGSTPSADEHTGATLVDAKDDRTASGGGVYHRPDGGGGADSIGGGSMGGGITPIYLVNGGGSGTSGAAASSRLVLTKSSSGNGSSSSSTSSGGDQDVVYNNRTHCGGVGANSMDGVVSGDSGAVANGKLSLDGTGAVLDQQQQQQHLDTVETNSAGGNKRMTRSGKGKAASTSSSSASAVTASSTSAASSSSTIISSASSNALITSAAKKLRRGSVTMEEEVDPLADTPPHPQQQPHHTQQTISSANGSN